MSKIKKIAEANFKLYPKRDKQFIFPDGVCFFREAQAKDYAKSSKQEYETVTREAEKGGKDEKVELTKEEAEKQLMGLELDKDADYELLGNIIDALELKPVGRSKEDRIKALLPVRNDLLGITNQ